MSEYADRNVNQETHIPCHGPIIDHGISDVNTKIEKYANFDIDSAEYAIYNGGRIKQ
mgnify:FL=1